MQYNFKDMISTQLEDDVWLKWSFYSAAPPQVLFL